MVESMDGQYCPSSAFTMSTFSNPHTWTEDTRDPIFQVSFQDVDYGFYMLSIPMWIELLLFILANVGLAAVFAVALYPVVKYPCTVTAYLTGFGLFLPFWILAPYLVTNWLNVRNKIFLFCACVLTPTVSIFRIMEAIFGLIPSYASQSPGSFALYFASPM